MAYSTTAPARLLVTGGMTGKGNLYAYESTEDSSDVADGAYFAGCGDGGRGNANIGMKVGDIVLTVASTDASQPGEVIAHSVISSTIDQATTAAATAFNYSFDVTICAT